MPLGMEVGLGLGDFVLDGNPAPTKGAQPPFLAHVYCGQTAGWMRLVLGMEVGLSPGDCVRWGPSPQFSAHLYCGQTAAWIKMPLGTEVGLSPDDIVLDGDPARPPLKGSGAPSPIFSPCLSWANGWMDQDGTWHADRTWSRPHCAR